MLPIWWRRLLGGASPFDISSHPLGGPEDWLAWWSWVKGAAGESCSNHCWVGSVTCLVATPVVGFSPFDIPSCVELGKGRSR